LSVIFIQIGIFSKSYARKQKWLFFSEHMQCMSLKHKKLRLKFENIYSLLNRPYSLKFYPTVYSVCLRRRHLRQVDVIMRHVICWSNSGNCSMYHTKRQRQLISYNASSMQGIRRSARRPAQTQYISTRTPQNSTRIVFENEISSIRPCEYTEQNNSLLLLQMKKSLYFSFF